MDFRSSESTEPTKKPTSAATKAQPSERSSSSSPPCSVTMMHAADTPRMLVGYLWLSG